MLDQKFLIQIADLFSSLFNFSFDILFREENSWKGIFLLDKPKKFSS